MLAATLYQRTVDRAEPNPLCFFKAPLSEIKTQKTSTNVNRCCVQSQGLLTLQKVVNPNQRGQFVVWHARKRLERSSFPPPVTPGLPPPLPASGCGCAPG